MNNLVYKKAPGLEMVFVEGTDGRSFLFGTGNNKQPINIKNFFIAKFTVTQALWKHVMNEDDSRFRFKGDENPAEHVSWFNITGKDAFLEKINSSGIIPEMRKQLPANARPVFRLPSETEWEYAARGGDNWADNFIFSGSNNADDVAWFLENSGKHTSPVGLKAPNQLGIHDMCGNVWEWCQDYHVRDTNFIPRDGSPFLLQGTDRVLRGGCHHNGAVHCTATKRYEIIPGAADECIGFRLALSY